MKTNKSVGTCVAGWIKILRIVPLFAWSACLSAQDAPKPVVIAPAPVPKTVTLPKAVPVPKPAPVPAQGIKAPASPPAGSAAPATPARPTNPNGNVPAPTNRINPYSGPGREAPGNPAPSFRPNPSFNPEQREPRTAAGLA